MGNGLANIIAAVIVAGSILYSNGLFQGDDAKPSEAVVSVDDEDAYAVWLARAVGDIRNDVVVNCGCCGEGKAGPRRAANNSF